MALAGVLTLTTGDKCPARDVAVLPVGSGAENWILKELSLWLGVACCYSYYRKL